MKYYTSTTQFNCGIDLHARQMYVCLIDRPGKILLHTNIRHNDFNHFLKLIAPYRHDLTVCAECMFGWYWLADACHEAHLTFVLAHALYLKAIHGGKNKNDRIDSEKLAHLLRSNLIPPAYVYPAELRPLRALLRQRTFFVWRRSDLLARLQSHQLAHNRPTLTGRNRYNRDPWQQQLLAHENHPIRKLALENELALVRHFDERIIVLETQLQRLTKEMAGRDYTLLQTVPGIGQHRAPPCFTRSATSPASRPSRISCPIAAWSKAPSLRPARSRACAAPSWAIPICVGPSAKRRSLPTRSQTHRPTGRPALSKMNNNKFKATRPGH